MRHAIVLFGILVLVAGTAAANSYGSVEPIPNRRVIDTTRLRDTSLAVREAFAYRVLECRIVDDVIDALALTGATSSINELNTSFTVTAGGFNGSTNPTYGYVVIDSGPNGVSTDQVAVLTNSLGYVLSQGSAFLLDADDPSSYGFPANYVVLNFEGTPSIEDSAALFETVGMIDPELFETDTSGYTQYGFGYLSLQSFVPDQQFIDGYVQAAAVFGVEYTPFVAGEPALFTGGADFPFNDWTASPNGEDYLSRIPMASHDALTTVRERHLRITRRALRRVNGFRRPGEHGLIESISHLSCQ